MPQKSAARNFQLVGNWKMHGAQADLAEIKTLAKALRGAPPSLQVMLCLPATLLAAARPLGVRLGAQACHSESAGAHTGALSAPMLREAGADAVLCGHSETRAACGLSDGDVAARAKAVRAQNMCALVCIGEQLADYKAGRTAHILRQQWLGSLGADAEEGHALANTMLAYEPVWAIGSGKTPSPQEIGARHADLRRELAAHYGAAGASLPLLYGGSVAGSNAAEILALPDVNEVLVGGASLRAKDFLEIIHAARKLI